MGTEHLEDELTAVSLVVSMMRAAGNDTTARFTHLVERANTLREMIEHKRASYFRQLQRQLDEHPDQ